MTIDTPVAFTPGRMPTVAFSDDADYDALSSLLRKMSDFVWQVELRNGTLIIGVVTTIDDSITITQREDSGMHDLVLDAAVTVHLDDVARLVYV